MDPRHHILGLPEEYIGKCCSRIDAYCKFLATLLIYDFLRRMLSRADADLRGGRLEFLAMFENDVFAACQKHANWKLLRKYSAHERPFVEGLFEPTTGRACGAHVAKIATSAAKIFAAMRRTWFYIDDDPYLEGMLKRVFSMRAYGKGLEEASFLFKTLAMRRAGYDLHISVHRQEEINAFNAERDRIRNEVDRLTKQNASIDESEELIERWTLVRERFERQSLKAAEMLARYEIVRRIAWW